MIYALLLLGLLPVVFLPEPAVDSEEESDDLEPIFDASTDMFDEPEDSVLEPVIEDDVSSDTDDPNSDPLDPIVEDDFDATLDPVIEDDLPSDTIDPDDVLAPVIEDDVATIDKPDPDEILAPVIEDDVAGDDTGLAPIIEDDAIPTSAMMLATVSEPALVEEFDAKQDVLVVQLEPGLSDGPLDVETEPSADGEDTLVYIDDILVATLEGAADVDPTRIYVQAA